MQVTRTLLISDYFNMLLKSKYLKIYNPLLNCITILQTTIVHINPSARKQVLLDYDKINYSINIVVETHKYSNYEHGAVKQPVVINIIS